MTTEVKDLKTYMDPNVTLYCGNSIEVLKSLPELNGDYAVLTDPDYKNQDTSWFDLIKNAKTIIFTPGTMNTHLYPQPKWILCWHKPGGKGHTKCGGWNQWEPVLVYGKVHFDTDYFYQVPLNFSNGPEREHIYPKPLSLWKWLIMGIPKNLIIIDPFVGSGTTLVAAIQLGRKAIGIEISDKYHQMAIKRIQETPARML